MAVIYTKRFKHKPNDNWHPGQPVGALVKIFRLIKYLVYSNFVFDVDQALYKTKLNCYPNFYKQLFEYNKAA